MEQATPIYVHLYLRTALPARDNRRLAWKIVVRGLHSTEKRIEFYDFGSDDDYELFQHYVDHSFERERHELSSTDNEAKVQKAVARMRRYAEKLIDKIVDQAHERCRDQKLVFFIHEARNTELARTRTFHTIIWELLEELQYWPAQAMPREVHAIRAIWAAQLPSCSGISCNYLGSQQPCFSTEEPIRMLLLIGRSMRQSVFVPDDLLDGWSEQISAGLIQRPIMQSMLHLEEIGHKRRIELEIRAPESLEDLKKFLKEAPKADGTTGSRWYDLIHLDMHGDLKDGHQSLLFTTLAVDSWVRLSKVARLVRGHTNLVVLNSCNRSTSSQPDVTTAHDFLGGEVRFVSLANFRLLQEQAQIYYPRFYMSLFLHESFHDAAVAGRGALRQNKKRVGATMRNDAFVQSVYSRSLDVHSVITPGPSRLLRYKAILETIAGLLGSAVCYAFGCRRAGSHEYCNYRRLSKDMSDVSSHMTKAKEIQIPKVELPILQVEYHLRRKSTLYLHAGKNSVNQRNVRYMIRNMVPIWLRTNFVSEVHIISVAALVKLPALISQFTWLLGSRAYRVVRPSGKRTPHPVLGAQRLLIIEQVDRCLLPQTGSALSDQQKAALTTLGSIFAKLESMNGTLYQIVMGSQDATSWNSVEEDLPRLGLAWSAAQEVLIMENGDVKLIPFGKHETSSERQT